MSAACVTVDIGVSAAGERRPVSAAWARDVARGMGYAFTTAAAMVAVLAAGSPATLADVLPDAPRVSSVVGARMDNFNPGASLDTSQVIRDASMDRGAR